jgi:hypothetical protein
MKPQKVLAWISVADPDDLHRCMIGIARAMDYGKVSQEIREAIQAEREEADDG